MFHVIVCFEKRYPILLESFKTYSEGVSYIESLYEVPKMPFEVRDDDLYEISIVGTNVN